MMKRVETHVYTYMCVYLSLSLYIYIYIYTHRFVHMFIGVHHHRNLAERIHGGFWECNVTLTHQDYKHMNTRGHLNLKLLFR